MQSSDPQHFFESDASQATRERKAAKSGNSHGNPMRLKSKINAAIADPHSASPTIFVAESAGRARRINVESQIEISLYRGPSAPLTSIALGGKDNSILFAGCWDKTIWSWDVTSSQLLKKYEGHSDFVKAVVCATVSAVPLLISGGADKKIMVWNVATGERIHTLQDPTTPMMAVQHLAVDPLLTTPTAAVLVSAGSDPHLRRWRVSLDAATQLAEDPHPERPGAERPTILEHETSVYKVVFDSGAGRDDDEEVDLLTASADGTAKMLSRSRAFAAGDVFWHTDYVRAVAATDAWVLTGGRDEHVKVWDRATGQLHCQLEGHYDEVTDLVVLPDERGGQLAASVSIDGTIRTWPLDRAGLDRVAKEIEEAKKPKEGEEEAVSAQPQEGLMTADEEAELAALMEDD